MGWLLYINCPIWVFKIMKAIPSISSQIDEKIIFKVIDKHFSRLAPYYYKWINSWLIGAYKNFGNIDKYIILIYIINQDFIFFRKNGLIVDYDTFYKDKKLEDIWHLTNEEIDRRQGKIKTLLQKGKLRRRKLQGVGYSQTGKSGKLINQIIQGASKSFDKPKQTKDAIDTLILKGEIEKDISLAKGNSSTQQLAALSAASGKSPKFVANAKLGIANTPGEAKSQLVKLKKGTVTSDDVTAVIVSYWEENGIPFKKQITTEQKNEQVGKGKKFASVTELIDSLTLDPNGADDGLYVVGTSVVEVDKGIPKLRG